MYNICFYVNRNSEKMYHCLSKSVSDLQKLKKKEVVVTYVFWGILNNKLAYLCIREFLFVYIK